MITYFFLGGYLLVIVALVIIFFGLRKTAKELKRDRERWLLKP